MPSSAFAPRAPEFDPEREFVALSEQTRRIVSVAQAMVASLRPVDLAGFEANVGLLCAKALDLPPDKAPAARLELSRLLTGLHALELAIREQVPMTDNRHKAERCSSRSPPF